MMVVVLVRYGVIPEVSRFAAADQSPLARGEAVVVQTHRGLQAGIVLSEAPNGSPASSSGEGHVSSESIDDLPPLIRRLTPEDEVLIERLQQEAHAAFDSWCTRIADWGLELEVIDLEWTIDRQKLILYVLNNRGPDCTKLALQAAAGGLGIVEVQPVTADGLVTIPTSTGGGGCGSCGCHEPGND